MGFTSCGFLKAIVPASGNGLMLTMVPPLLLHFSSALSIRG